MVRAVATTASGLEDLLARELEAGGARVRPDPLSFPGRVAFEAPSEEAVARTLLSVRTAHRLGVELETVALDPADGLEGVARAARRLDVAEWMGPSLSFACRARRGRSAGEAAGGARTHPFSRLDVERAAGGALHDALTAEWGRPPRVHLVDPDVVLRVDVDAEWRARFWVDLVGYVSLHRRGWRVVEHPAAMKSTLACALLALCGWDGAGTLVDPMCGGGTLGIEAAWMAHGVPPIALRRDDLILWRTRRIAGIDRDALLPVPPLPDRRNGKPDRQAVDVRMGDRFEKHVRATRANCEAAGVARDVQTFTSDAARLSEQVAECRFLVTNPPYGMRIAHPAETRRAHRVLLEQAERLLAGNGRLGLLTPHRDLVTAGAVENGLQVLEDRPVRHGDLPIRMMVLGRAS